MGGNDLATKVEMLEQLIGELTAQVRLLTTILQKQNGASSSASVAASSSTMSWADQGLSQEE